MRLIPSIVIGYLFGCTLLLMPAEEVTSKSIDNILEKSIHTGLCYGGEGVGSIQKIGAIIHFDQENQELRTIPYITNIKNSYFFLVPTGEDFKNFVPVCLGKKKSPPKPVLEHLEYYPKLSLATEEETKEFIKAITGMNTDIAEIPLSLRDFLKPIFEKTQIPSFQNKTPIFEGNTIKLVDANNKITNTDETTEESDKRSCIQKPSNKISPAGKHKLIVISLTDSLDQKGNEIHDSLIKAFSNPNNRKDPFTLLAISSGRKRNNILNSSELEEHQNERYFLESKIKELSFSSSDLRAMDDLELIDIFINEHNEEEHNEPVGSVIYLTDNTGDMSGKIPYKKLGVPWGWRKNHIELTVLTTVNAGCDPWEQSAEAKSCFQVLREEQSDDKFKDELRKRLNNFLQAE